MSFYKELLEQTYTVDTLRETFENVSEMCWEIGEAVDGHEAKILEAYAKDFYDYFRECEDELAPYDAFRDAIDEVYRKHYTPAKFKLVLVEPGRWDKEMED